MPIASSQEPQSWIDRPADLLPLGAGTDPDPRAGAWSIEPAPPRAGYPRPPTSTARERPALLCPLPTDAATVEELRAAIAALAQHYDTGH